MAQTILIDSSIDASSLTDVLRRAAAFGETRRVPDPLKAEEVDALDFVLDSDGTFRIVPVGLRNGLVRPRITVEGRGQIKTHADSHAQVYFEVGLDTPSLITVATSLTLIFGLAIYNLVTNSTTSFWVLTGFGSILASILYIHSKSLVKRAWPGLLVEVRHLAEGTLYVPTA